MRWTASSRWRRAVGGAGAVLVVAACGAGPRPIAYGRDACAYCLMQISDARYAAELVTHQGKVYTFDSIECLVAYDQALDVGHRGEVESLWVSDYAHPGTLIPATSAWYRRASGPASPMGRGMMAVADTTDLAPSRTGANSAAMTWRDVLALAEREHWSTTNPEATAPVRRSDQDGAHVDR